MQVDKSKEKLHEILGITDERNAELLAIIVQKMKLMDGAVDSAGMTMVFTTVQDFFAEVATIDMTPAEAYMVGVKVGSYAEYADSKY